MPTYLVNENVGAAFLPIGYLHPMKDLGKRLRQARTASQLTQAAVARHFGIARVSVTQWEIGETRPDPGKFAELAKLYAVDLDWLLNGEGSGPSGSPATAEDIKDAESLRNEILALTPEDRAYIRGRIDERLQRSRSGQ